MSEPKKKSCEHDKDNYWHHELNFSVDKITEKICPFCPKESSPKCEKCGWPLKDKVEDGCVKGDCSQRPIPKSNQFSRSENDVQKTAGIREHTAKKLSSDSPESFREVAKDIEKKWELKRAWERENTGHLTMWIENALNQAFQQGVEHGKRISG